MPSAPFLPKFERLRGFHRTDKHGFHYSVLYGVCDGTKLWEFELASFALIVHALPAEWGTWSARELGESLKRVRWWRILRCVGFGFLGATVYLNIWRLGVAINVAIPTRLLEYRRRGVPVSPPRFSHANSTRASGTGRRRARPSCTRTCPRRPSRRLELEPTP